MSRDLYDQMLVMKSISEEILIEAAIEYGALELYLLGGFADYRISSAPVWASDFIYEGQTSQRFNFTAEELLIRAHEYDKRELGLANFFPPIVREPFSEPPSP